VCAAWPPCASSPFPPDVGRPIAPALPAVVREAPERKGLRLSSPRFFPSWAANLPNSISRVFSAHSGDAAELALMALTRESRDTACESRPEILHCVTERPFCLIITGLAARYLCGTASILFPRTAHRRICFTRLKQGPQTGGCCFFGGTTSAMGCTEFSGGTGRSHLVSPQRKRSLCNWSRCQGTTSKTRICGASLAVPGTPT
jgi:hypothetical protein